MTTFTRHLLLGLVGPLIGLACDVQGEAEASEQRAHRVIASQPVGLVQWGEPANGLRVGLAVSGAHRTTNVVDRDLTLIYCLQNVGEEEFKVLSLTDLHWFPDHEGAMLVSVDGRPRRPLTVRPAGSWQGPGPSDYVKLAPKETLVGEVSFHMPTWIGVLREPQNVTVAIRYANEDAEAVMRSNPLESDEEVTISGLWTGAAQSGEIDLRVEP